MLLAFDRRKSANVTERRILLEGYTKDSMFWIANADLLPLGVFTSTWCQLRGRLLVQVKERILILPLQALLALGDIRFHVHDWIIPVFSVLIWLVCDCLA